MVGIAGDEPPKPLATDADRGLPVDLVNHCENSRGVFLVIVHQPGGETAQIFAVEKCNGLLGLDGSILSKNWLNSHGKLTEKQNGGEQGTRNKMHNSFLHHSSVTSKRLVKK